MTSSPGKVIRFTRPYIFTPDEDRRSAVKYPAGWTGLVRQQCVEKAIAAGAAVVVTTRSPRRRKAVS